MKKNLLVVLILAFIIGASSSLFARIYYVDSSAVTGLNNGSGWPNAFRTVTSGLTASVSGDTIWVANGTYYPGVLTSSTFTLKTGVNVIGGFSGLSGLQETLLSQRDFNANRTILSGDLDFSNSRNAGDAFHVVTANTIDTTAVLDGFIITWGNAAGGGGGANGGGLYAPTGSPTVRNCTFIRNFAASGGAIYGTTTQFRLINCKFYRNTSTGRGGAIFISSALPLKIINCIFYANSSTTNSGGGIYSSLANAVMQIINCSFRNNSSAVGAGGLFNSGSPIITNCILWGNTPLNMSGGTPVITYSDVGGGLAGLGNISVDPIFVDTLLRVSPCSPVVDTGTATGAPGYDITGAPRPFDGDGDLIAKMDMGAYESQTQGLEVAIQSNFPLPYCPVNTLILSVENAVSRTYQWYFNGSVIPGATGNTYLPPSVGNYNCFVNDTLGNCADSANVPVFVDTLSTPVITLSPSGATVLCAGSTLNITASGALVYQWFKNGVAIPGATGPVINVGGAGFYNALGEVGAGCGDSANVGTSVTVASLPVPEAGAAISICRGDCRTLTASAVSGTPPYSFTWQPGGATGPSFNACPTVTTTYTLNVSDVNSCTGTDSVTLTVYQLPVVSISPTGRDTICPGDSTQINASFQPGFYQWVLNGNNIPGAINTSYFAGVTGNFNVRFTDFNTCSDTAAVSFRLLVSDLQAPQPVCRDTALILHPVTGTASLVAADLDAGSTDNCGIASRAISRTTFGCAQNGLNVVTLTITDLGGNQSTCTSNVTVLDQTVPIARCSTQVFLTLDLQGNATLTPSQVDSSSFDACGIPTSTLSKSLFTCANIGTTRITMTLTDPSGNSSSCQADIVAADNLAPVMICRNLTMSLDSVGQANITAGDVNGGSTDNCGLLPLLVNRTTFGCLQTGPNTVILTGLDVNGNSSSCNAVVTVLEDVPPVALCRQLTLFFDPAGVVNLTGLALDNGSTDNCLLDTLIADPSLFTCGQAGLRSVNLIARDASGNADTCSTTVLLSDNTPPMALCTHPSLFLGASGSVSLQIPQVNAGSTDNCGITSISLSRTLFSCADTGQKVVTLNLADAAGNLASCLSNVSIADTTAPQMICRDTTLFLNINGFITLVPADLNRGSSDNCGIAGLVLDQDSFACAETGLNVVTLTGTDVSGNVSSCASNVSVLENSVPTALCRNTTLSLGAAGTAILSPTDIDNGSLDNCGVDTLFLSRYNFSCVDIGPVSVTLSVRDGSGNTATCTGIVTVRDNTPPVPVCISTTVFLNPAGQAILLPSVINGGSSDNCSIGSSTALPNTFSCVNSGSNSVTLTVSDPSGNFASCVATVTVRDTLAPVMTCRNITVYLDGMGQAVAGPGAIGAGTTDNCGVDTLFSSQNLFTCANTGVVPVVLSARDDAGNTGTCNSNVTVIDTIDPVARCRNLTVYLDNFGMSPPAGLLIDNGSSDICSIDSFSTGLASFTCANLGQNQVALQVFDPSGNSDTCSSLVLVMDTIKPVAVCVPSVSVFLDASGMIPNLAQAIGANSFDNCGVDSLSTDSASFDCSDLGSYPQRLTVWDFSGNSATCNTVVTVADSTPPFATCNNLTIFLDGQGSASISLQNISPPITDNCGLDTAFLSRYNFDCQVVGSTIVTLTATDINGNTRTCNSNVMVMDTIPFLLTCPANVVFQTDSTQCSPSVNFNLAVASDNCGIDTLFGSHLPGGSFPVGTTTVTYTAINGVGNSQVCNFTVEVRPNVFTVVASGVPASCGYHIGCNGDSTGTAIVTISGGCLPYSLQWSTGATTLSSPNLAAGTYSVTVTDGRLNVLSGTVTITEPLPLSVGSISSPVLNNGFNTSCGNNDGSINLTVTGGADCNSYTYQWAGPNGYTSSSSSPGNLFAGTYDVTVTDTNGCSLTSGITLSEAPPATIVFTATDEFCAGSSDGKVVVALSGGSAPFSYAWSNGTTNDTLLGVTGGVYWVDVTDVHGCMSTDTVTVGSQPFTGNFISTPSPVSICIADTISVQGAPGFVSYIWSNGDTGAVAEITAGGMYYVTVTSAIGCTGIDSVSVVSQPVPPPNPVIIPGPLVKICVGETVVLDAQGGYFTWEWSTGALTRTITVSQSGFYQVTVSNGNGCYGSSQPVQVIVNPLPAPPVLSQNGDTLFSNFPGASAYQWFLGGNAITGATAPWFVATVSGNYSVTITDTNGCTASGAISFTVGIQNAFGLPGMEIYPNPTTGILFIQSLSPLTEPVTLSIFDLYGKEVMNTGKILPSEIIKMDLTGVATGIYFLKISTAEGTWTGRVIRE